MSKDPMQLKSFFERYAVLSSGGPLPELADCYAESFIVAGPEGNAAFRNDDAFARWLEQVAVKNREYGLRVMEVVGINELPLNDLYTGAIVTWGAQFEKTGAEQIRFKITYFLSLLDDKPKIIMYISDQSQEALMKSKGLL
ncbi:hypothetical protein [Taibaiella chishuiensis]|uniref:SnoaL-like protein n=1 Tax=Taibaiella chishuiensis TaxID=1434707 RepID=A0A2P8D7H3_9BACT|nr:hypothetical protein [Taibaiella chishuiensis]PSK93174.1 hypothetical protein B0I18_102144 [Taibaiella chishuiensis]